MLYQRIITCFEKYFQLNEPLWINYGPDHVQTWSYSDRFFWPSAWFKTRSITRKKTGIEKPGRTTDSTCTLKFLQHWEKSCLVSIFERVDVVEEWSGTWQIFSHFTAKKDSLEAMSKHFSSRAVCQATNDLNLALLQQPVAVFCNFLPLYPDY